MKIHLISFDDGTYALQKKFFKETAIASLFFDDLTICGREHIDLAFYDKYKVFFNQAKGMGYWFWKPFIIKKILNELSPNDILVYCDIGFMINCRGKKRFDRYIDILMNSYTGSLALELPQKEIEYTKNEVFDYFEFPSIDLNSNQLTAKIFLLRNCDHTILLVDKWYNVLCDRPLLFTDDMKRSNQKHKFIKHKYDQSIFSIIRKIYGTEIISDETLFKDFIREGHMYPFWNVNLSQSQIDFSE